MTEPQAIAELRDVDVTIGDACILSQINLRLPPRAVVAVIGASGSGKTTLLKLFNGLRTPASGVVLRDGRPLNDGNLRDLRMDTGYALQQIGLLPHLTARQNIALPMRLADWPAERIAARIEVLLQRMQLSASQAERFPAGLSGGQQQRAGLCRALALQPSLLLLDEAFSGLDAITRLEIHERFNALRESEINACLLVTHDLAEARRLADQLVILKDGQIIRQGHTQDVMDDPGHPYARQLIETFA